MFIHFHSSVIFNYVLDKNKLILFSFLLSKTRHDIHKEIKYINLQVICFFFFLTLYLYVEFGNFYICIFYNYGRRMFKVRYTMYIYICIYFRNNEFKHKKLSGILGHFLG